MAKLPADALVHDLGAGEGCFSHTFATSHPRSHVMAVEADVRLKSRFYGENPRVEFVPHYIENFLAGLTTTNGQRKPDLVVLTDVLEHLIAPEQLLKSVARVLAPGGYAYLTVPDADTFEPPFPYKEERRNIDWRHANRTCQHLWMMEPKIFRQIVSDALLIVAESQTLETSIRRDSSYTTILAKRAD